MKMWAKTELVDEFIPVEVESMQVLNRLTWPVLNEYLIILSLTRNRLWFLL